jgi:hypothetical protein
LGEKRVRSWHQTGYQLASHPAPYQFRWLSVRNPYARPRPRFRERLPDGLPPTNPSWTKLGTGTQIWGATRVITCRMWTGHAGYTTASTPEEEQLSSCVTCPEVFS